VRSSARDYINQHKGTTQDSLSFTQLGNLNTLGLSAYIRGVQKDTGYYKPGDNMPVEMQLAGADLAILEGAGSRTSLPSMQRNTNAVSGGRGTFVPAARVKIAGNLRSEDMPDLKELNIANALATNKRINVLLRGANIAGGDATIILPSGQRLRAEFKTFDRPTGQLMDANIKNIFDRNLRVGSDQTGSFPSAVVLDPRNLGLTDAQITSYATRSIANVAPRRPMLQQVFVITNNGVVQIPISRK
jgi:hypothetical protein